MLVVMVITLLSALLSCVSQGRRDRSIMLISFVKLPIEMVFFIELYKKRRLGKFFNDLTILFLYTYGCQLTHLNRV